MSNNKELNNLLLTAFFNDSKQYKTQILEALNLPADTKLDYVIEKKLEDIPVSELAAYLYDQNDFYGYGYRTQYTGTDLVIYDYHVNKLYAAYNDKIESWIKTNGLIFDNKLAKVNNWLLAELIDYHSNLEDEDIEAE
jgi:hypothetical protein